MMSDRDILNLLEWCFKGTSFCDDQSEPRSKFIGRKNGAEVVTLPRDIAVTLVMHVAPSYGDIKGREAAMREAKLDVDPLSSEADGWSEYQSHALEELCEFRGLKQPSNRTPVAGADSSPPAAGEVNP